MKKPITEVIQVDPDLAVPVYKQIVQSIRRSIETGMLEKDDLLPSVNRISETFSLARGSVFTAYNDLRASGIIDSIPGKGYFVTSTETRLDKRILLLLDAFTPYMGVFYESFLQGLPEGCWVDVHFHRQNQGVFEAILREQAGYFNTFVLVPPNGQDLAKARLDLKRTFLVHTAPESGDSPFPGVHLHIKEQVLQLLKEIRPMVQHYRRLVLVGKPEYYSQIILAFTEFSTDAGLDMIVTPTVVQAAIAKGDACILLDDDQLVAVLNTASGKGWEPGSDIGVLSYGELPLKSAVGKGITTFSPDYAALGQALGAMVGESKKPAAEGRINLVDRGSF